jgi:hypothetical protein
MTGKPKAVKKTRKQWAAAICAAHKRLVANFFQIGETLVAANEALPHGTFLKMIEADLPFTARTAQMLMKIARDKRIANAKRASLLPLAWGTVYELTKLTNEAFEQALRSGAINPQMTRDAARSVRFQVEYGERSIAVPYYVGAPRSEPIVAAPVYRTQVDEEEEPLMRVVASATPPADVPPADVTPVDVVSLALLRFERAADELVKAIRRGDVKADATIAGRIKAVSDRLLATTEAPEETAP